MSLQIAHCHYSSGEDVPEGKIPDVCVIRAGPVPVLVKPIQYLRHGQKTEAD